MGEGQEAVPESKLHNREGIPPITGFIEETGSASTLCSLRGQTEIAGDKIPNKNQLSKESQR